MTLRGHEPAAAAATRTTSEIGDRLRAFEVALWELIIHLPQDAQVREEILQAGCGLADLIRSRVGTPLENADTARS